MILGRSRDEGDPLDARGQAIPHVFVTPHKLTARLFSVKSPEMHISSLGADPGAIPYVVYSKRPDNVGTGYVYAIDQKDYKPFEQTVAREKNTGKFVSYERLDVSAGPAEIVAGVRSLMQEDKIQVFYLRDAKDEVAFFAAWNGGVRHKAAAAHNRFMADGIISGRLRHMNAETGVNPHPRFAAPPGDAALRPTHILPMAAPGAAPTA